MTTATEETETPKTDEVDAERDKAQAAKKQKIEDKEKKTALTDYGKKMVRVKEVQKMTETAAWKQLYKSMKSQIVRHAESLLDHTMGTKDVIYHQQGVRKLRELIDQVKAPLNALESFVNEMPLFATDEIEHHAEWNEETGTVTIS